MTQDEFAALPANAQRALNALYELSDEIMSDLHAGQLRDRSKLIPAAAVVSLLRGYYNMVRNGLGNDEPHFDPATLDDWPPVERIKLP